MSDALNRTLADLADWLHAGSVPFAVIGGIAASVRGEPRFTADVDVVVGIDVPRALQLIASLQTSVFQPLFSDVAEVVQTAFLLPIRHEQMGIRVDMAIGLTGFERQLIARATEVRVGDCSVPVATAEDLILLKLLASRPRDTEDVTGIVLRQGNELDWDYLMGMGEQLQQAIDQDLVSQLEQLRQSR